MKNIKPITKFDGYFVSEDGIVYSNKSGRMKELSVSYIEASTGLNYKFVKLQYMGREITKYVHRLVHETFNNSCSRPFHKDGNCFNNHYENLVDKLDDYVLQSGERWVEGFEDRYFIYGDNVYSVYKKEYPVRLKPSSYFAKKKYSLVRNDGKTVTYYL